MYRVRAHGRVVAADLPLPLPEATSSDDPDLTILGCPGAFESAWSPAAHDVLCHDHDEVTGRGHVGARVGDGYRLRLPGLCEFDLDPELTTARWRTAPGADPALVPLVGAGVFLAFWLCLRGTLVLHASTVSVDGRGLTFLGRSGMGKSTMAAALCATGALLVSDDVAAVDLDRDGAWVWPGAGEVRLRLSAEQARNLAGPAAQALRETVDARRALSFRAVGERATQLSAAVVVLPVFDRPFELRRLAGGEALAVVHDSMRISGIRDVDLLARQFGQCADLLDRVPVYAACIPWGSDAFALAVAALRDVLAPPPAVGGQNGSVDVAVADRRRLVRESVAHMLAAEADLTVVELVGDAPDLPGDGAATLVVRGAAFGTAPAGGREHRFDDDDSFDAIRCAVFGNDSSLGGQEPTACEGPSRSLPDRLTARELEVVRAVARGLTTREIATALRIAPKSVDSHRQHIFEKLGVQSAAGAVRAAAQAGLLEQVGELGVDASRVLIGHSAPLLRDVVRDAVQDEPGLQLDPPVARLAELRDACRRDPPAVVIAGLSFPDGELHEVVAEVLMTRTRLLVLCGAGEAGVASTTLFSGAAGCLVVEDAGRDDVVAAVRSVTQGRAPLHPAVAFAVLNRWRAGQERAATSERLSERELQVLRLLADGRPTRAAAGALAVSPKTIEAHVARMMAKLGARNRAHLVTIAAERDLLAEPGPRSETGP